MPFCGTAEAGAQVALSGPQTRSDRLVRRVPVKVLKSMLKSGLIRFEPPPMPAAHAQALAYRSPC